MNLNPIDDIRDFTEFRRPPFIEEKVYFFYQEKFCNSDYTIIFYRAIFCNIQDGVWIDLNRTEL